MDIFAISSVVVLFFLLIHSVVCQGQQNCSRNNLPTYTCTKWNECNRGKELIQQRKAIFCGLENSVPKLCCPPVTRITSSPNTRRNAVAIAERKCNEYAGYRFTNITIPGVLYGDPPTIHRKVDCKHIQELIINGVRADAKEYPHMALIGYGDSLNSVEWLCGGSLISERFVMSAAHCSISSIGEAKWVLLGDLDINSQTDDARPKIYRIIRRIDHPNYRRSSVYDDISLFQLNSTVEFSPFVRPTCLYTSTFLPSDVRKLSITGWGSTGTIEPTSDHLLKTTVLVVNDERCQSSYRNNAMLSRGFDSKSMVCAGDTSGNDTCKGDSGGPLQIPLKDSFCMWTQVGITSYGPGLCGDMETPAIYTKVANYIEWIQSIVWP